MELWDEVIQEFNEEIQRLRLSLGNGSADDYAHYRQLVGSIQGLEWARINLNDIVKKRIFSEEDEE
jgi:thymidylate synthase ThyX